MSWRPPTDLNDFEKQMVSLEPEKDFIFRREAHEEDTKRRNILTDRRRNQEDQELNLLAHLHDNNIIPKIPGKLLDREDLVKSDPTVECVKMMRQMGMESSISDRMVQSRSIASKKKQPKIMYDRRRPVLLGSEFFEFKLVKAKRSETQPKQDALPVDNGPSEVVTPPEEHTNISGNSDSVYFDCGSTNSSLSYYSCGGQ